MSPSVVQYSVPNLLIEMMLEQTKKMGLEAGQWYNGLLSFHRWKRAVIAAM
jgi:hypothetical protein